MKYGNINDNPIVVYNDYPEVFGTNINFRSTTPQEKYDAGFRDVIIPTNFNFTTQYLGSIFFDTPNDIFTYPILDRTEEEIQSQLSSQAELQQQELINQKLQNQIITEAQTLPDNEALDNQPLYPLWNSFADEYFFEPPIKVQDFLGTELKLYKCFQANNKRVNTRPNLYPAGWTLIEFSNGIEIWSPPTGGDGKYPYIDPLTGNPYLVEHNGQIWQNNHKNNSNPSDPNFLNVWEPGVFGWIIYTG